ncbi:MAG TPA: lysophospholipid acyltransferase family protein [Vicinamibacterales bacterium]|nr:lysophospholipid acyltransferase family protein [Vicinamibacterales bacterium]
MPGAGLSASRRLQASLIAFIAYPALAALCRTYRWKIQGAEQYDAAVASGKQPILALWHGRILPGLHYFRNRRIVVITSQNFDGEWIARILHRFGFGTARGSSSRGGARALVQMRRDLADGRPAAFTVDGPRGPARVVQRGVVFLAGATGHPILPYHIESDRHWTLNSWDRTQIPKPFSTVALVMGEPMCVESVDPPTLEQNQASLAAALSALEARALDLIHAKPGQPG